MTMRVVIMLLILLPSALAPAARAVENSLPDTGLKGDTYRTFELAAPVPDFCRAVCDRDSGCRGWTFAWPGKKGKRAVCELKRTIGERVKDTCCISGLKKQERFSFGDRVRALLGRMESGTGNEPDTGDNQHRRPDTRREASPAVPLPEPREDTAAAPPSVMNGEPRGAEKRLLCQAYARAAIDANRDNRRLRCGYRGALWGASPRGYFNWCMRNSVKDAERNTKARLAAIEECSRRASLATRPHGRGDIGEQNVPARARREAPPPPMTSDDPRRGARHLYSWLRRGGGGGPARTPWRPTLSGKCPLVRACECPQANTCGVYPPGGIVLYWPNGCQAPPATLVCRVRRR